ncbi:uncharacterized protein LOC110856080 [Folsomia candida]|uniref:uncharacterized protein LOC110856080 n=1 Tax=Folsomia candida TaxID=158441 RepID=UPI000B906513|nr:uncharacterized protein LOC110856080 [Folsomia candida]
MKRLSSQIQKLNPEKFAVYDKIFKAWIEEKFIEVVTDADKNKPSHYLPHRPVFKPESVTTPVRPVFDASCKVGRAPSINECLEKGPNLMELIPSILLRFRENEIGVVSDIRKAFQMIEIKPPDRDFLRFLWWEDFTCSRVIEFRHNRVVFGINCSPFILAAVLEKHLKSVKEEWQHTAKKLLESLYVDNCVTSVRSIQEYEDFKRESIDIMEDAKMDLCQWERSFIEMDQDSDQPPDTMVLGLIWNKKEDSLRCKVKVPEISEKLTKREILSKVRQIFDPIGFSSPTTLQPKVMLQEVWANKLGWDDELPDDIVTNYKKWYEELACLTEVRIPRWISCGADMEKKNIQLHVFCDASQTAYAAVIFLRVSSEDDVKIHLLQAKSRVAPLKKTTIPRLELLGCTIAARLKNSVATSLNMRNVPTTFWSDSTTALSWIQRNNEWGTFVGNRVREILKMSDAKQWKHVPGKLNPADLPSRGCNARELVESRWWKGPDWLREDQNSWPSQDFEINEEEITAEKKKSAAVKMAVVTPPHATWCAERFSSFCKNVCVVGWMKRFHHNATRSRCERIHSRNLTVKEVEAAEATIMKLIQQDSFPKGTNIIGGIEVIIREDGLICAKTKLLQSDESESFRKPVLLPKFHPIVEQLIREEHCMNGHAGAQFLMGHLRKKYWILQGRQAIKKVIHSCTICKRFSMKKPEVPAGLLPSVRVKMGKVFEVTGVDLAGPLFLKNKTKVWICLFTCAVYRCVHLELVGSISTESFLLALERFIARRGRPTTIYSDNGTNFTGASHYFKELNWKKIEKETAMKRINWIFNPPSAPWWGGWWERLIKIVKDLLRRMLGNSRVDYHQLESCICSVESVVNARPLTFVSGLAFTTCQWTCQCFRENSDGTVEIPWKKELGLDCVAVGVPEPTVEWSFNGGGEIHGGNGKREGSAKSYTLTGLHANTRYDIRVTSGNHAGDTLAKYEFLTGSLPPQATTSHSGGKYRGESTEESRDGERALGENKAPTLSTSLLIVFPSILALIMVTAVISFFCYFRRKRILGIPHPKRVIGEHNYAGTGDGTSYLDRGGGQGQAYGHGQGGIMYDAATPHQHYKLVKGSQGQGYPPDLTTQYATKGRDLTGGKLK